MKAAKKYLFQGEALTVKEVAQKLGISITSAVNKLKGVPPIEESFLVDGKPKTLKEYMQECGISKSTALRRLKAGNLSKQKHSATLYEFQGELLSISDIAIRLGLTYNAVRLRIERGTPLEMGKHAHLKYLVDGEWITRKEYMEKKSVSYATAIKQLKAFKSSKTE